MIKSTYNQLANVTNSFQGDAVKALCICSAGLLRSPTMAEVLIRRRYNARACGTSEGFALIPLSTALLHWADEIYVVEGERRYVMHCLKELELDTPVFAFPLPDKYERNNPALIQKFKTMLKDKDNYKVT